MFKKVQIKFFAFTAGILLALIAAVLISINIIMETIVENQSRVILKQIAASIEYDEKTSTFTYFEKKGPPPEHDPINDMRPTEKSSQPPETAPSETESTEALTENPTQNTTQKNNQTTYEETQENDPPKITSPIQTNTESQTTAQTETQSVHTEKPAETTGNFQQPTAPPEWDPDFNHKPPEWENPPDPYGPNDPNDDFHGNNGDYPPYPDQGWGNWNPYRSAPEIETSKQQTSYASFSPSSLCIMNLSGRSVTANPIYASQSNERQKKGQSPVPKTLGSINFFVLMADKDGNYLASLNNDDLDSNTAQYYVSQTMSSKKSSGIINKLQFYRLQKTNGTMIVFTDKGAELNMLRNLTKTTIIIGIISFILLSLLTLVISRKSIQPIKMAFEKQKHFISDASHELKTPLTIISANADVLSDEIGDNKWLNYIKSQTERMNVLVNDLLNLTRIENKTADFVCSEFNLSKAIESTALPFECQAFEMQKSLDIDIQEDLMFKGSEDHIKQMAAIFIDNALKYSNDQGKIKITLKAQGDKRILSVFNTGSGIKEDEKEKIFERFYRSDDSRARSTGGYGLGLAIAKSIIDRYKFKISVEIAEGKSICFTVTMQ